MERRSEVYQLTTFPAAERYVTITCFDDRCVRRDRDAWTSGDCPLRSRRCAHDADRPQSDIALGFVHVRRAASDRRRVDHDAAALERALDGCQVLVNCAPAEAVGQRLVRAALDAGIHYVDAAGEQHHIRSIFERYDEGRRSATWPLYLPLASTMRLATAWRTSPPNHTSRPAK